MIDTGVAIGSLGFLAMEAAKVANEGGGVEAIIRRVGEAKPKRDSAIVFETLKYLARGGRIGKAKALLGTVLSIKPIIGFKDGITVPLGKVRTHEQGLEWIANKIRSDLERLKGDRVHLIIEDIDNKEFNVEKIFKTELSVMPDLVPGESPGSFLKDLSKVRRIAFAS